MRYLINKVAFTMHIECNQNALIMKENGYEQATIAPSRNRNT